MVVDLDELTDHSYEPRASLAEPLVVPLGGNVDVHCRMPDGRPAPSMRFSCFSFSFVQNRLAISCKIMPKKAEICNSLSAIHRLTECM